MGKYLKLFSNNSNYANWAQSDDYVEPSVCYTIQENSVHYNPYEIFSGSLRLKYSGGQVFSASGFSEITTATTHPTGYDYSNLQTAELGSGITSISAGAFDASVSQLEQIDVLALTPPSIEVGATGSIITTNGKPTIVVPSQAINDYLKADKWGYYGFYIEPRDGRKKLKLFDTTNYTGYITMENGSNTLTATETHPSGYDITSWTRAFVMEDTYTISANAFKDFSGLRFAKLHEYVASIGAGAFDGCASLLILQVLPVDPPTLGAGAFDNVASGFVIYVPDDRVDVYKEAQGWDAYASIIKPISEMPVV